LEEVVLDSFQNTAGQDSQANGSFFDSNDNLWVTGFGSDGSGSLHWIVRTGPLAKSQFSTSDDFQLQDGWDASGNAITVSPDGTVWAVGNALDSNAISHWIVRRFSPDGTWATSDDFQYPSGLSAESAAVVCDSAGTVYVAGFGTDGNGTQHWIVREKPANGIWSVSDDFQLATGNDSFATGLAYSASNHVVYAGGFAQSSTGKVAVVRSLSASAWTSLDVFQVASGRDTVSLGLAVTGANSIFSIGYGNESSGIEHWIVRSSEAGQSWALVDDRTLVSASSSFGQSIAASGNLVSATGYAVNASGALDLLTCEASTTASFIQVDNLSGASATDVWLGTNVSLNSKGTSVTVGSHNAGSGSVWIVRGP
jgi:hypothetical protein